MKRDDRRITLILAFAFLLPGVAAAQAVDGPGARFDDDLVSRLQGHGLHSRSIRGTEVLNRVTATWVLNHQFLELHMRDVAKPPKCEAIRARSGRNRDRAGASAGVTKAGDTRASCASISVGRC